MPYKFYEVSFKNGYSIAIKGARQPSLAEAAYFCGWEHGTAVDVREINEYETKTFFDCSKIDEWPIFGAVCGGDHIPLSVDSVIEKMQTGAIPKHTNDRELLLHYASLFKEALKIGYKTLRQCSESGNAKELRAALAECIDCMNKLLDDDHCKKYHRAKLDDAMITATKALTQPPRNCDIGTVQEQVKRLLDFCNFHGCISCRPCHESPGCMSSGAGACAVVWLNTPYKEKEKT